MGIFHYYYYYYDFIIVMIKIIYILFSEHGKDPRKVFREMDKKKIGSHSAEFYKSWSEVEKKHDEPSAQLIIDKVV